VHGPVAQLNRLVVLPRPIVRQPHRRVNRRREPIQLLGVLYLLDGLCVPAECRKIPGIALATPGIVWVRSRARRKLASAPAWSHLYQPFAKRRMGSTKGRIQFQGLQDSSCELAESFAAWNQVPRSHG
jgi:hypothetical protein